MFYKELYKEKNEKLIKLTKETDRVDRLYHGE